MILGRGYALDTWNSWPYSDVLQHGRCLSTLVIMLNVIPLIVHVVMVSDG